MRHTKEKVMAKSKGKAFPKVLHVSKDGSWYNVETDLKELVQDMGKTVVGVYEFKGTKTYDLTLTEVK